MGGLSKREKILLVLLLVCVVGFVYYRFVLTVQLNKLNDAKNTLEVNRQRLETLKVQEKSLDGLKKEVEELAVKADEVDKVIPITSKIPEVIMNIRDMAAASGCKEGALGFGGPSSVNVTSQDPGNQQGTVQANGITNGVAVILPLTYQIKGSYSSVMAILAAFEGNTRKMLVDKMTISKEADTTVTTTKGTVVIAKDDLTVNLSINTLFRRTGEPDEPVNYPFLNIDTGKNDMFK